MGEEMNDIVTYREAEPDARVEGIIAKNNENRVWWQAFCAMTQSLPEYGNNIAKTEPEGKRKRIAGPENSGRSYSLFSCL